MFPAGSHDDQVDTTANTFNVLAVVLLSEGSTEFYRRQATFSQAEALVHGWSTPSSGIGDAMVTLLPRSGTRIVIGMSGAACAPDLPGLVSVSAKIPVRCEGPNFETPSRAE